MPLNRNGLPTAIDGSIGFRAISNGSGLPGFVTTAHSFNIRTNVFLFGNHAQVEMVDPISGIREYFNVVVSNNSVRGGDSGGLVFSASNLSTAGMVKSQNPSAGNLNVCNMGLNPSPSRRNL